MSHKFLLLLPFHALFTSALPIFFPPGQPLPSNVYLASVIHETITTRIDYILSTAIIPVTSIQTIALTTPFAITVPVTELVLATATPLIQQRDLQNVVDKGTAPSPTAPALTLEERDPRHLPNFPVGIPYNQTARLPNTTAPHSAHKRQPTHRFIDFFGLWPQHSHWSCPRPLRYNHTITHTSSLPVRTTISQPLPSTTAPATLTPSLHPRTPLRLPHHGPLPAITKTEDVAAIVAEQETLRGSSTTPTAAGTVTTASAVEEPLFFAQTTGLGKLEGNAETYPYIVLHPAPALGKPVLGIPRDGELSVGYASPSGPRVLAV